MEIAGIIFFACLCAVCVIVFIAFVYSALNDPEEWQMKKQGKIIAGVRRGEKLRGGK